MEEIYEKLEKLEKYISDIKKGYEQIILKKAEVEKMKIKLREALAAEELSEQERRKAEKVYNQLVRVANKYETAAKNLKRDIYNISQEIMKLMEYLPKEKREKLKKDIELYKIGGTILSIFLALLFLAVLNYFRIIHKTQEIIGQSALPYFSFNSSNLLASIIVLFLLLLAFKKVKE